MSLAKPKFQHKVEVNGDTITFYVDSLTVVSRKVIPSDREEYPDLFPKRGRKKKVSNDDQGNTESGIE
jgi:hypothetical protein